MTRFIFFLACVVFATLLGRYLEKKLTPKIGIGRARLLILLVFWGMALATYFRFHP